MGILDSVLRGGLEDWIMSKATALLVPKSARLVDSILMHPEKLFPTEKFNKRQKELCKQRTETLKKYPSLNKKIKEVFQH